LALNTGYFSRKSAPKGFLFSRTQPFSPMNPLLEQAQSHARRLCVPEAQSERLPDNQQTQGEAWI
jgi:hypothetical protein